MTGCAGWFTIALLLLGCSERDGEPKADSGNQDANAHRAPVDLPAQSKRNLANKLDLERRDDCLWYKDGALFTGIAVIRFDNGDIEWEETYKDGVRMKVKGWDVDREPMELFSWDKDGEPLHQRPNPR